MATTPKRPQQPTTEQAAEMQLDMLRKINVSLQQIAQGLGHLNGALQDIAKKLH